MEKKYKKILMIIAFFVCVSSVFITQKEMVEHELHTKNSNNVGPLKSGDKIEYRFICGTKNLSGIDVLVATYGNVVENGTIDFELIDCSDNSVVIKKEISVSEIKDNRYLSISFDTIEKTKDIEYMCSFEIVNTNVPITFWTDNAIETKIELNNKSLSGNLIIKTYELQITRPYVWDSILVLMTLSAILALINDKVLEKNNDVNEEIQKSVKN